jgi:hypothetical protein
MSVPKTKNVEFWNSTSHDSLSVSGLHQFSDNSRPYLYKCLAATTLSSPRVLTLPRQLQRAILPRRRADRHVGICWNSGCVFCGVPCVSRDALRGWYRKYVRAAWGLLHELDALDGILLTAVV